MLSLLLSALDSTVVSTAMKTIVYDLNGVEYYTWPFTIYILFSTIITPVAGGFSDILGRKPVFSTGILVFLIGSTLSGLSQNMIELIVFRGIQGLGGGIIVTIVFTIVGDIVSPQNRGKYMGIVTSVYGLSSIVGPIIGGLMIDHLTWRWIFFINIPLGAISLLIILFLLPKKENTLLSQKLDIKGTISLTLALIPLLLIFSLAEKQFSWISIPSISMFIFALIMLFMFIRFELNSKNPLIPMDFFINRSVSLNLIVAFLTNGIMFACILYIPYFSQIILKTSATTSGIIIMPMMLSMLFLSIITGIAVSKIGKTKLFVLIAFILMTVGTLLLTNMDHNTSYFKVIIYMIIIGSGIGINMPIANLNAQNAVSPSKIGSVTSTVQFFRNIGSTISSALCGTIMISLMNKGIESIDMSSIPTQLQDKLKDPSVITNNQALNAIINQVSPKNLKHLTFIINYSKEILVNSISKVFLFCLILSMLGLVTAFFFKEVPVRKNENHYASKLKK